MANVTVKAPASLLGATWIARDGTSYAVPATGLLSLPQGQQVDDAIGQGFTVASDLAPTGNTGLTAHSGGGAAQATALSFGVNQIATVGTSGDSAIMPNAVAGEYCIVANDGAKAAAIFPQAADNINALSAGASVTLMPSSVTVFYCAVTGSWRALLGLGFSGQLSTELSADALTAHSTGGQSSALLLTAMFNRFTVVAAAGDSAKLQLAAPGLQQTVINASTAGNSMNVFPSTGDAIGSGAANAAFAVPMGCVAVFYSTVAGVWHVLMTTPTASIPFTQYTSISTGNGTLTGAQVAGAALTTLITSGATALTTPTAAQILAAIPNGQVGMSYRLRFVNTNAGTLTITADGSITTTGTLTLATNTSRDFDVTIVTATTATMKQVGTGTTS